MVKTIENELADAERQMSQLRIDYERFFSGELKLFPFPARRRLNELLKRLGNIDLERPVDRARLQAFQGRVTALHELADKRLKAREEGRGPAVRRGPPKVEEPAAPSGPQGNAPGGGPVKAKGKADFRPLYERYVDARKKAGEDVSKLQYERFEELVRAQAEQIRQKTGSAKLIFEIRTEDGKVRLVGRPAPTKG